MICGAENWVAVEEFGLPKEEWFTRLLGLEHDIPSHDTFGEVYAAIDTDQFSVCFSRWVGDIAGEFSRSTKNTVINTLKKSSCIIQVNPNVQVLNAEENLAVRLELACEEAEIDEQWSMSATSPINVGSGMPLIMPRIR